MGTGDVELYSKKFSVSFYTVLMYSIDLGLFNVE